MLSKDAVERELLRLKLRIETLEQRRDLYIEEYSNVYPPSTAISMVAGQIYAVPIFPSAPINLAAIYATVLKNGGGAPQIDFAIALYKVEADQLFHRSYGIDDDNGSLVPPNRVVFRQLSKPLRYNTASSNARRFVYKFFPEIHIDPRDGVYAIAYQTSTDDGRFLGPMATDTTHYCGFATGVRDFGDFPLRLLGVSGAQPVPSFTLRTAKAMRHIGR